MSECSSSSVAMALTRNTQASASSSENVPRSSLPAVGMQDNVGRAIAAKLDLDAAYTPCEVVNYAMNKLEMMERTMLECAAEVISAFNNSYRLSKEVFLAQPELQFPSFSSINNARIPGMQTNENMKIFCGTRN